MGLKQSRKPKGVEVSPVYRECDVIEKRAKDNDEHACILENFPVILHFR